MTAAKHVLRELMRIRHKQGVSRGQMAKRLDINPQTVSNLECGSAEPRLSTLMRYGAALGVRVRVVVDEEPP